MGGRLSRGESTEAPPVCAVGVSAGAQPRGLANVFADSPSNATAPTIAPAARALLLLGHSRPYQGALNPRTLALCMRGKKFKREEILL